MPNIGTPLHYNILVGKRGEQYRLIERIETLKTCLVFSEVGAKLCSLLFLCVRERVSQKIQIH